MSISAGVLEYWRTGVLKSRLIPAPVFHFLAFWLRLRGINITLQKLLFKKDFVAFME